MKLRLILPTLAFAALLGLANVPAFGAEVVAKAVTGEELSTLANEVNLLAWSRIAGSADFTLEESWVAVYSPKDEVGQAQHWGSQLAQARFLAERATQPSQKRWLRLFINAGEAVARKDSGRFALAVRALGKEAPASGVTLAANFNFFRAK